MSKSKRKVAIFTANRAEYGLQYPIIKAISQHPKLDYYLFVSGSHLDEKFGYKKKEIENDGFKVYKEIKGEVKRDDLYSTTQVIGHIIINLSKELKKLEPDFLVVYGDRFESLAAVVTGSQMGIPVAHIEGGDVTEGGALDDYARHAMTKLSHIHFTTNKEATKRVGKFGEEKWRIHNVGYPSIDLIKKGKFATLEEIKKKVPIDEDKPIIVFTQHSVTTELKDASNQIKPSIQALKYFAKKGLQVIITYPNNDAGGLAIIKEIDKLKSIENISVIPYLGRHIYHGVLKICGKKGVCVGNTSSGIKETPAFGCPFVNIGSRQRRRLRSCNVIDVGYKKDEIIKAIEKSLYDKEFRKICKNCKNPYGKGQAGEEIAKVLSEVKIDKNLIQKKNTYWGYLWN